jgi:class 3 adenylate cyclase
MERPEPRFVDGGHCFVAYEVVGEGRADIVYAPSWGDTLEGIWESPAAERFLRRLAGIGRLVLFDKRGTGISDPLVNPYDVDSTALLQVEEAALDLETVMDHLGIERATLIAPTVGSAYAIMFAATRPERTAALVLIDPLPRLVWDADYPWGLTEDIRDAMAKLVKDEWGTGQFTAYLNPSMRHDPAFMSWAARYERVAIARGVLARQWIELSPDVRSLLPSIQCPTLVMHHTDNPFYDGGQAVYTAGQIPDAIGPVEIPGSDVQICGHQPLSLLDDIESFLNTHASGQPSHTGVDRVFAVVAFIDLVDSTKAAAEMGDRRWIELLDVFESLASRQIRSQRGLLVQRTGDGILATFDAPARAIRGIQAIHPELRQLGVKMRAGLHAGEVELHGDNIGGLAVHLGARVSAHAGPGETLVSRTLVDLVSGSGIAFEDRGEHELKGVPGTWQLYAVT